MKIHEDANGIIYTVGITMKPVSSNQDVCFKDNYIPNVSTNVQFLKEIFWPLSFL